MSITEHKALIQRLYEEAFNRGEIAVVDKLFSPAFRDNSTPAQAPGVEGVKSYILAVREGFPDIHVAIEDMIAEADKIAVRTVWHGKHLGTYEGIAPTGKYVTRTMIQLFSIVDGKIAQEWVEGAGLEQAIRTRE
ncbi:MAG: ester cyclase [Ktedonobacteraceae bacterium]